MRSAHRGSLRRLPRHHTRLCVRWFADESECSYSQGQIGETVHVNFLRIIERAFVNIFEHTSHHTGKRMPRFNLPPSQHTLEQQNPGDVFI